MNFTITRTINNNVFDTKMQFASYGALDITSDDEQSLLTDYPIMLEYSTITFSGKYTVTGKDVIASDTGDVVNMTIPNKRILLDKDFVAEYSISTSQILDSEIGSTALKTKELVAQAKCLLFENAIKTQITTLLTGVKAKDSNFAKQNPINITI